MIQWNSLKNVNNFLQVCRLKIKAFTNLKFRIEWFHGVEPNWICSANVNPVVKLSVVIIFNHADISSHSKVMERESPVALHFGKSYSSRLNSIQGLIVFVELLRSQNVQGSGNNGDVEERGTFGTSGLNFPMSSR